MLILQELYDYNENILFVSLFFLKPEKANVIRYDNRQVKR